MNIVIEDTKNYQQLAEAYMLEQIPELKIDTVSHMVNRFLGWRLPENFCPDGGISFKQWFNEHTEHPMRHEPSGTNLFNAEQAKEMFRYLVEDETGNPVIGHPIQLQHWLGVLRDMPDKPMREISFGMKLMQFVVWDCSASPSEREWTINFNDNGQPATEKDYKEFCEVVGI